MNDEPATRTITLLSWLRRREKERKGEDVLGKIRKGDNSRVRERKREARINKHREGCVGGRVSFSLLQYGGGDTHRLFPESVTHYRAPSPVFVPRLVTEPLSKTSRRVRGVLFIPVIREMQLSSVRSRSG